MLTKTGNLGKCVACKDNSKCRRLQYCQNNRCVAKRRNGLTCGADGDCRSNFCDNGRCRRLKPNGASCSLLFGDRECASTFCDVGECVACLQGSETSTCGEGQYCSPVTKRCAPQKQYEERCNANYECVSNKCKSFIAFGVCTGCLGHGDCEPTEYCPNTIASNCTQKEPRGFNCLSVNEACASGKCGDCGLIPQAGNRHCKCINQLFSIVTCC